MELVCVIHMVPSSTPLVTWRRCRLAHGGVFSLMECVPCASRAGALATAIVIAVLDGSFISVWFIHIVVWVIRIDRRFNGRADSVQRAPGSSRREVASPTAFTRRHRCPCGFHGALV
jgi:hypothetical protein